MKLRKCFELALNILLHSKLRSWLTILGIVIGVASVVSIVSIGEGLQSNLQSRLGGLGADILTINPGASRAEASFRGGGGGGFGQDNTVTSKGLTIRDLQTIRGIGNIKSINTIVNGNAEFYFLGQKSKVSISGVDPLAWAETTASQLEIGRMLNPSDSDAVILGSRIAKRLFKEEIGINKRVSLNNKTFVVVGILKEAGNGGEDNKLIMNINSARNLLPDFEKNSFSSLIVKTTDQELVDSVLADIDAKLSIVRHTTEKTKDYTITSAKATQERIADITSTMTLFLGAIAFVSLIVGAVGIANTMFTSVIEKTKEIGIMKAIGAKNRDIMAIFLINAGLVGLVGGIIGILLGSMISSMIPSLGLRLMGGAGGGGALTTVISPSLLIYALLLSLAIGMISGAIPSYRASKLKPVDALRY